MALKCAQDEGSSENEIATTRQKHKSKSEI